MGTTTIRSILIKSPTPTSISNLSRSRLRLRWANSSENSSALSAALGHGDPNIIKNNLSTIDTNLDNFAKRNRLDSDQAALQKSNVHADFHAGVVTQMMDQGFYKQAQDYFDKNVDDIAPKSRKDIQDYIDKIPKQHEETT